MLKKPGLPDVTLHACRHSHASLLLRSKESIKVISQRLGHASVKTTQDVYAHLMEGMERRIAAKMDALFGNPMATLPQKEGRKNRRKPLQ